MSFEGRVVAITGGSSGIGLATAKLLFSLGAKLSIADYNPQTLGTAAATILSVSPNRKADDILITQLDVRSSSAVNTWVSASVAKFGKLDGAVNAAGVPGAGMGADRGIVLTRNISDDDWRRTIDTNLSGLFYCLRAELNAMQSSGGGSIVNLASIAGIGSAPGLPDYAASKHGVVGLTKTAATEEGRSNIRINAVAPGPTDTPMLNSLSDEYKAKVEQRLLALPISRSGKAEEVAGVIKFLLSEEAAYITGEVIRVDGGAKA